MIDRRMLLFLQRRAGSADFAGLAAELQLIADGHSNQDIAARLCLSVKTVEAHKSHIMRKLNLRGRTELIKYAIRKGMIDLGEPV